MDLVAILAAALAVAYLAFYLAGHRPSAWRGTTTPAPDDVTDRLPFESPPILVTTVDAGVRAAGTGPPGSRRVLVDEDLLDEDELAAYVALAVGKFETNAFDVATLAHLVRLELLFGLMVFLVRSAQVDRRLAVAGAVVAGVLVVLYLLQRIVARRVGAADDWASSRVGRDAVASVLDSRPGRGPTWVPDLLRPQPRPERRLARLETRT